MRSFVIGIAGLSALALGGCAAYDQSQPTYVASAPPTPVYGPAPVYAPPPPTYYYPPAYPSYYYPRYSYGPTYSFGFGYSSRSGRHRHRH
jgi:hypothetical protein